MVYGESKPGSSVTRRERLVGMLDSLATVKGTVLKIERFAIHDGPGIRTVVFLKGCPLECRWCSTPESQNIFREMEYSVSKCTRSAKCIEVCPVKAVTISGSGEIFTDMQLCDNCGQCVVVCPSGARTMVGGEMTVGQVLEEIEKDTVFYWNSGGGVTLSGGEPTMQPKYALEILKACKGRGIHTAIETCGYVKWDTLDEMLQYLDLVHVDIKHMLPVEHKKLTGKENELILENIGRIAAKYPDKPLIVRIPVIPGYSDSDENILSTAQFVSQLKGNHKIELLPYHKFGVHNYSALSRDYSLSDLESPSADRMRALEELVKSCGIQAQIGG